MDSKNTYMTLQTNTTTVKVLAMSSDFESLLTTEILSINVLNILGLVLIIINAALTA